MTDKPLQDITVTGDVIIEAIHDAQSIAHRMIEQIEQGEGVFTPSEVLEILNDLAYGLVLREAFGEGPEHLVDCPECINNLCKVTTIELPSLIDL